MADYQEIESLKSWEEIFVESDITPIFVFKHSSTCPISANAWREWKTYVASAPMESAKYALVKVIEARPVSNQIATDLAVKHESPQAILIHKRTPVWHASHYDITHSSLQKALEKVTEIR